MGSRFPVLLIVLCAAAIFLLLRIVFFSSEESQSLETYDEARPGSRRFRHSFASDGSDERSRTAPVSDSLGRVVVSRFNFAHFDAVPGPTDPENFADELLLELYDSVSDFRWNATYVVATPSGIRKLMDEERWSFFYATEIFVVRRYDLETIRRAVYGRIKEVNDEVPLGPEEPPFRSA